MYKIKITLLASVAMLFQTVAWPQAVTNRVTDEINALAKRSRLEVMT